jgi:hypothetical protein
MLSYSTTRLGKGWVYGVNTALDETGATIGPLLMALVLFKTSDYRVAYALLLISSLLALSSLTVARITFPVPSRLEEASAKTARAEGFTTGYWLYMVAGTLFAAGLMSFEFISFHLSSTKVVTQHWIPIFLAISTGVTSPAFCTSAIESITRSARSCFRCWKNGLRALWECGNRGAISRGGGKDGKPGVGFPGFPRTGISTGLRVADDYAAVTHAAGAGGR